MPCRILEGASWCDIWWSWMVVALIHNGCISGVVGTAHHLRRIFCIGVTKGIITIIDHVIKLFISSVICETPQRWMTRAFAVLEKKNIIVVYLYFLVKKFAPFFFRATPSIVFISGSMSILFVGHTFNKIHLFQNVLKYLARSS